MDKSAVENLVTSWVYDLEWRHSYYSALLRRYDITRKVIRFSFALGVFSMLALLFLYLNLGSDDKIIVYAFGGILSAVLALGIWDTIFGSADVVAGLSVAVHTSVSLKLDASRLEYELENNLIADTDAHEKIKVIQNRVRDIELYLIKVPTNNKLAHKCQQQAYSKVRFETPVTKV